MLTFPNDIPTIIKGDDINSAPSRDMSIDHYPFAVIPKPYFEDGGHLKECPVKSYAAAGAKAKTDDATATGATAKGGRKQSRKYRRRNNKNTKKRQRRSKRNTPLKI